MKTLQLALQDRADTNAASFVREARAKSQENQTQFAARFGISQSLLSKYELGRVEPPASMLLKCMQLLEVAQTEVTPEELVQLVTTRLSGAHTKNVRVAIANVISCLP